MYLVICSRYSPKFILDMFNRIHFRGDSRPGQDVYVFPDATLCETFISATVDLHPAISTTFSKVRFIAKNNPEPTGFVPSICDVAPTWWPYSGSQYLTSIWSAGTKWNMGLHKVILDNLDTVTCRWQAVAVAGKNWLQRWFRLMTRLSISDVTWGAPHLGWSWMDLVLWYRVQRLWMVCLKQQKCCTTSITLAPASNIPIAWLRWFSESHGMAAESLNI